MARATGQERCVPIRVHGATCAGAPLREAMFDSIYVKENAGLLLLEKPTYPHAWRDRPGTGSAAMAMLLWPCCCPRCRRTGPGITAWHGQASPGFNGQPALKSAGLGQQRAPALRHRTERLLRRDDGDGLVEVPSLLGPGPFSSAIAAWA